jgi:phosphoribosyl 1,2-cyclic phosphodiesterase
MPGQPLPYMTLKFRGVRGSVPTPAPANLRYGGNTTCLEVGLADGRTLVIDAGTGIRGLGLDIGASEAPSLSLLLTHFHWDHIQGIPFFTPLYSARNHLDIYSPRPVAEALEILEGQMSAPLFPVPFECLAAVRQFHQVLAPFQVGPVHVTPFPLNHPQGASGYRLDCAGHSIVHACDHEPGVQAVDERILRVAEGADVLICDAQYTPAEYEHRRGWGHGTWLDSVKMAQRAGVGKLVLTHHDPDHDDAFLDAVLASARREFPSTLAAAEGLVLSFP